MQKIELNLYFPVDTWEIINYINSNRDAQT